MRSRILHYITIGLLISSMVLTGISIIPRTDWATFDRTSSVGPLEYRLRADFDAIGFEYSLETDPSTDGGGIIGSIGGGIGSNISREEEWKTYPEVKGEVLDNLGILYDSYKDKSYRYELVMRDPPQEANITWDRPGSPAAILNVSLKADLIPFWPASGSRPLDVKVTFLGSELKDLLPAGYDDPMVITLKRITIKAMTGYDKDTGEYEGEVRTISTVELSEKLIDVGDGYQTSIEVKYPEGEDAVGFVVEIEASMIDHWGRSERSPLSGKANPINIRPIENINIIKGAGIPLSLPLLILSILLSIGAIIVILVRKKNCPGLIIPALAFSIMGPFWFWNGMNAAIDILSQRLSGAQDGLHWTGGFFLAVMGAVLILAALLVSIFDVVRSKKEEKRESEEPLFKKVKETGPPAFKRIGSQDQGIGSNMAEGTKRTNPPPPMDPFK